MVGVGLRLLALLIVVTGGPLIALASMEAFVRHDASVTPDRDDDSGAVVPISVALAPGPLPQFVGRPKGRDGNRYTFEIDDMELGRWDGSDPVVLRGVALAPWRRYRIVLLPGENGEPREAASVETLGVRRPAGVAAFNVLPLHGLLAILLAPSVLVSAVFLVMGSRRQARDEERGVEVGGLRPRSAVVAAQKRLEQLV